MDNNVEKLNNEKENIVNLLNSLEEKVSAVTNELNKLKQQRISYCTELCNIKKKINDIAIKALCENGKRGLLEKCNRPKNLEEKYNLLYEYWNTTFLKGLSEDSTCEYCKYCTGDPIDGCKGCTIKEEAWQEFKKIYNL